jgi:DNA-binding MarR family transcriptional regulator
MWQQELATLWGNMYSFLHMSTLISTLQTLGLNEKEAQVYLLLLNVGSAPASVIGTRAAVPKSTARYICRELAKKGLVSLSRKRGTFLYAAEPPDRLTARLDRQKEALDRQREAAQKVAEELQAFLQPAALPRIRYYEGPPGVADAYMDIVRMTEKGGEILSMTRPVTKTNRKDLHPHVRPQDVDMVINNFLECRLEKHISIRMLAQDCPEMRAWKAQDKEQLRETRLADCFLPGTAAEVLLSGDKLFAVSLDSGVFAYVMQDPNVVAVHRAMFELAWQTAGRKGA